MTPAEIRTKLVATIEAAHEDTTLLDHVAAHCHRMAGRLVTKPDLSRLRDSARAAMPQHHVSLFRRDWSTSARLELWYEPRLLATPNERIKRTEITLKISDGVTRVKWPTAESLCSMNPYAFGAAERNARRCALLSSAGQVARLEDAIAALQEARHVLARAISDDVDAPGFAGVVHYEVKRLVESMEVPL